jgi:hypothetical protein
VYCSNDVPCSVDSSSNVIMCSGGKSILTANNCYKTVKCGVPYESVLGPLLFIAVMMYRVHLITALM